MEIRTAAPYPTVSHKGRIFRFALWAALEAFTIGSLCYALICREAVAICLATVFFLMLPYAVIKLFHCEMNTVFFSFCLLYATGSMLGDLYNLYYITEWWDDLLHISAGAVFTVLGVYFAECVNRQGSASHLMKILFALFFSISIAALWEFFEYSGDVLFGFDMQHDTIIHEINSYLLGDAVGRRGSITGIDEILIGGQPLGLGGYLDIGLHDTMGDMLRQSAGAAAAALLCYFDRERHPLIFEPRQA